MKKIILYCSVVLVLFCMGNLTTVQGQSNNENLIRNLHLSYFEFEQKYGEYSTCLEESIIRQCESLLERDSMNSIGNYYIGLMYHNQSLKYENKQDENSVTEFNRLSTIARMHILRVKDEDLGKVTER